MASHNPDTLPGALSGTRSKEGTGLSPGTPDVAPSPRPNYGRAGRRGGRDGRIAPAAHAPARDKESDLSRALRNSGRGGGGGSRGRRSADGGRFQGQEAAASQRGGGGTPDAGVLGRSPLRSGFTNANHLLNFQYERSQAGHGGSGAAPGRGRGGRRGGGNAARAQPYNRAKFLQANFRFLVSDAADLRRQTADADLMLDWDDVLEVELLSPEPLQCPISLESPPLCPQITPCGHVFAFHSVMAHLLTHGGGGHVAGGTGRRGASPCPLCFQPLVARELRLVRLHTVTPAKVGDVVTFKLLRRPRHSIIPREVEPEQAPAGNGHATPDEVVHAAAPAGASGDPPASAWSRASQPHAHEDSPAPPTAAAPDQATPPAYNSFAKFSAIGDAAPLWRAGAAALSQYAAQVTSEGGLDAAMEAPFIYAAIDALAARATAWAERRQRLLLEDIPSPAGGPVRGDPLPLTPEEAGAAAAATVKQITEATWQSAQRAAQQRADDEALAAEKAAQKAALVRDFPMLQPAAPAQPPKGAWASFSAAHAGAAAAQAAEVAFSEDEDASDGLDMDLGGAGGLGGSGESGEVGARTAHSSPTGAGVGKDAFLEELHGEVDAQRPQEGNGVVIPLGAKAAPPDAAGSAHSTAAGNLGSSPPDQATFLAAGSDYYFYQAADGQWLFLTSLDARILLAHYGSYGALPRSVTGRLLEVDAVTQTEAVRKKMKFLGHLPLSGAFQLAEVDLSLSLPPEALAPFAEELRARERRRDRRAQDEWKRAAREAAKAESLAAITVAPTAADLKAMPQLSAKGAAVSMGGAGQAIMSEEDAVLAALAESVAGDGAQLPTPGDEPDVAARSPAQSGVSFAHITKLGFAATGPVLASTSPGTAGTMLGASPPVSQRPAWGRSAAAAFAPHNPPGQRRAGGAQASPLLRGPNMPAATPWSLPASSAKSGSASAAQQQAAAKPILTGTTSGAAVEQISAAGASHAQCEHASSLAGAHGEAAGKDADTAGHGRRAKRGHRQQTLLFSTTQRRY